MTVSKTRKAYDESVMQYQSDVAELKQLSSIFGSTGPVVAVGENFRANENGGSPAQKRQSNVSNGAASQEKRPKLDEVIDLTYNCKKAFS